MVALDRWSQERGFRSVKEPQGAEMMLDVIFAFNFSPALSLPLCIAVNPFSRWLHENKLTATSKPQEWSALKNLW